MSSVFPHRTPVDHTPRDHADVEIPGDGSVEVLQALSSDTAQAILGTLQDDPATASDIADAVDTSLQNAHYHLERLLDAGLVECAGTWYSSRGAPMTVYALAAERLVVQFGTNGGPRASVEPPEMGSD